MEEVLRIKDVMQRYGVGKPTAARWMKESGLLINKGKRAVRIVPASAFDAFIRKGGKR